MRRRGRPDPAVHAAVRPRAPGAGLHQGLCAGHPRERRPVYARRHLGRAGDGAAGPGPAGSRSCSTCSTRSATRPLRRRCARYKVEPYVVCADVYGAPPHTGRGGWTWYTGSASWLYRVGLEAILGFRLRGTPARVRSVHPARLARLRDHLSLPLGHLPCRCRELGGRRPRRPKRVSRWTRGAGGRGRTGGRRQSSTRSGLRWGRELKVDEIMETADRQTTGVELNRLPTDEEFGRLQLDHGPVLPARDATRSTAWSATRPTRTPVEHRRRRPGAGDDPGCSSNAA